MAVKVNLNAYFERIGFSGSIAPTLATLEAVHALHPAAIPFENLDPVMGRPVLLDQASLEQKMLHKGRGGYCFEHNTLLMNVLRDLDYTVRPYAARILWQQPEGGARMISHMVLVVDIAGTGYLCDVGMSSFLLTAPIKLRDGAEQQVGNDLFRVSRENDRWRLDVQREGEWAGVYHFDLLEQTEVEVVDLNARVATEYHSRSLLFASRVDGEARHKLSGTRLSTYRPGEATERRVAPDVETLRAILTEVFRITLPRAEDLDPALQRVIDAAAAAPERQDD